MGDHVHMCLSIPPKYAVSNVVGYIKGNVERNDERNVVRDDARNVVLKGSIQTTPLAKPKDLSSSDDLDADVTRLERSFGGEQ